MVDAPLTQNQTVEASETEDIEKVPRGGADPRGVQGWQLYASLQHRLVTDRQRKWNLPAKEVVVGAGVVRVRVVVVVNIIIIIIVVVII